ncbi:P-loop containing nucleoside triphosphate hydrolase protein [Schizosaccharomyces pombe]
MPSTWYPGHMNKTLKRLKNLTSSNDIFVEVRDARIPLTSRNYVMEDFLNKKNRIIVYNKCDLADTFHTKAKVSKHRIQNLAQQFQNVECWSKETSTPEKSASITPYVSKAPYFAKELLRLIRTLVDQASANGRVYVYFVGMPNTGKSSILNSLRNVALRKSKSAIVGNYPGVTKRISEIVRLFNDMDVYMLDTPGIMTPSITKPEDMLKLSLVGCVKEGIVHPVTVVDYLLFHLNRIDPSLYSKWSLPTNDVDEFLQNTAYKARKLTKGGFDENFVSNYVIQQYRIGRLGRFQLDTIDKNELLIRLHNEQNKKNAK